MIFDNIFSAIEARREEYIAFWQDVCNMESPTLDKAGVDAVGRYFIEKARERGWKTEVLEQPVSGDAICITMNPDAKGAPVAISGHMDTVHPVGSFGSPAVRIDRQAGRIFGPGVTDCKGGIVAGFYAMDALRACGFTDRPVLLLLQSDEENSSKTSGKATINWICEKAKNCVAFFNMEGEKDGGNLGVITRKGILRYRLTVTGQAAHSSNCAEKGINAIAEAAHKLLELEKMKDDAGLTCNCGVIEGGTVANTVPEICSFVADIRFATKEQMKQAEETVRAVAAHSYLAGSSCTVEMVSMRVSMEPCERNSALLERMNAVYAEAGLPRLLPGNSKGGSDAADVTVYGIPCVDSLGVYGKNIHSVNEYADIESLPRSAKRLAAVIAGL
ncbi:MAG: M20/M25/M40 family metallo-hydrolase [Clostridia bacterium]|nr:M20/M25/M40 family metallo-hydrolase [Clostridia bacterium]MBQ8357390.1 M20/M25/M40 family metallo-hydrolase [Clostridia bacterium]